MKKILFVVALLAATMTVQAQGLKFGIKGGLNLTKMTFSKDVYSSETDVTRYAKWEEIIKTTITLDATGAYNGYTGSVVATYGEPMPEIAALPERVGYVFEGYYDQPNGAGTQYYTGLGTGVRNWDKTTAAETLYAMWLTPCDLVPTLSTPAPITTI